MRTDLSLAAPTTLICCAAMLVSAVPAHGAINHAHTADQSQSPYYGDSMDAPDYASVTHSATANGVTQAAAASAGSLGVLNPHGLLASYASANDSLHNNSGGWVLGIAEWNDDMRISNLVAGSYQVRVTFAVDATISTGDHFSMGSATVYFGDQTHAWQQYGSTSIFVDSWINYQFRVDPSRTYNGTYVYTDASHVEFDGAFSEVFTVHPGDAPIHFDLYLEAGAGSGQGSYTADASHTAGIQSVLVQDSLGNWVTPESLGLGVAFDSGMASPNSSPVPEPTTIIIWSLLGSLAITIGWWRKRKAVLALLSPA
jgi:hypothetical protein